MKAASAQTTALTAASLPRRKWLGLVVGLLAIGLFLSPHKADAGPAEEKFIRDLGNTVVEVLRNKQITEPQREEQFRQLFLRNFDVREIGLFVLGRHNRTATEEQRAEYLRLFQDFIVRNYAQKLGQYSGESFSVRDSRTENGESVVYSVIERPSGPPVKLDWRVRDTGQGLRITDVVIEGVSMSVTHRAEFTSVISNGGGRIDALLTALKRRAQAGR